MMPFKAAEPPKTKPQPAPKAIWTCTLCKYNNLRHWEHCGRCGGTMT